MTLRKSGKERLQKQISMLKYNDLSVSVSVPYKDEKSDDSYCVEEEEELTPKDELLEAEF